MSVFAAAVDALFADPNIATDATWRAGGLGVPVAIRIVLARPDDAIGFGAARLRSDTCRIDVRVADVPNLAGGDSIVIGGTTWIVQGAPQRDADRLVWRAEAVAA